MILAERRIKSVQGLEHTLSSGDCISDEALYGPHAVGAQGNISNKNTDLGVVALVAITVGNWINTQKNF